MEREMKVVAWWVPNGRTDQDGSFEEGPGRLVMDWEASEYDKKHGESLVALASAKERIEALEALEKAAKTWFAGRRPLQWTDVEHAANPEVNCSGEAERALARAIAALAQTEGPGHVDPR